MSKKLAMSLAILVIALVAGCASLAPEPAPVPPTKTPKPTFTPTPNWTPTSLPFPTATAVPASPSPEPTATTPPTATPVPITRLTANQAVNVRSGPGTAYPSVGRLSAGESFDVSGRNDAGDWLKFDFNGREGWVTTALVGVNGDLNSVLVAMAPPVPTAAPTARPPQPTAPPAPTAVPATAVPSKGWMLVQGSPKGEPQCGTPHFSGQVQYANGSAQNGVCLLLDRYGPRTIKFSGGGGAGDGNWSFAPCGQENCGEIKIYVVQCPPGVDGGGMTITPGMAVPPAESDVFAINMTDKCATGQWSNIIFKNTRQ